MVVRPVSDGRRYRVRTIHPAPHATGQRLGAGNQRGRTVVAPHRADAYLYPQRPLYPTSAGRPSREGFDSDDETLDPLPRKPLGVHAQRHPAARREGQHRQSARRNDCPHGRPFSGAQPAASPLGRPARPGQQLHNGGTQHHAIRCKYSLCGDYRPRGALSRMETQEAGPAHPALGQGAPPIQTRIARHDQRFERPAAGASRHRNRYPHPARLDGYRPPRFPFGPTSEITPPLPVSTP